MVAGDLVNTASRVQSVAEPGRCSSARRRGARPSRAIVYEDAGTFELKGKEGETPLWKALRVVSGVRGSLKSQGLEAPFVGRDRELRQIKDLFHICADEGKAQLVSVTGIAGIGKSRLAWEFYKYFDGIAQIVYWHRGRCLAYGEGVTYWALADMVRMRCRIAEDDEPDDRPGEARRGARGAHPRRRRSGGSSSRGSRSCSASASSETRDRQDLFAAWRLFFERLADDVSDRARVRGHAVGRRVAARLRRVPARVVAQPSAVRDHAGAAGAARAAADLGRRPSQLHLALPRAALGARRCRSCWPASFRGCPTRLRDQILARAEGVPLVRGRDGADAARPRSARPRRAPSTASSGEVETLEVPETLHALIAARLDGLAPEERRLLGDAAVLGKTFTRAALAALSGLEPSPSSTALLAGLVRKEVLGLQSDPRSPEHGQYGFLQDLLRHVAYETLPKRERRAKHLAAAEHLSAALAEEEVAEVVASHLLDAYRLDPDAERCEPLRGAGARRRSLQAGERAASLGASTEAQRYFEQAAELADEPRERADALCRAGEMALAAGEQRQAATLFEQAIELYEIAR